MRRFNDQVGLPLTGHASPPGPARTRRPDGSAVAHGDDAVLRDSVLGLSRPVALLLALAVSLLGACGGSGGDSAPPPDPDPPVPPAVAGLRCTGEKGAGWCWQAPQPWGPAIQDVVFSDARNGWAVGDAFLRTTDGGATWVDQTLPGGSAQATPLRAIRFANANEGWLLGQRDGLLWKTRDAGQSWAALAPAPLDYATGVAITGSSLLVNGLFDGNGGEPFTLLSDDGGGSWRSSVRFVYPADAERGGTLWGLADGLFAASTDGGRSFATPAAWGGSPNLQPVVAADGTVSAWLSVFDPVTGGYGKEAVIRQGAGDSWTPTTLPPVADTAALMDLALFADGGWARTGGSPAEPALWHREAAGGPWIAAAPSDTVSPFSHGFVDGRTAWMQREGGAPSLSTDGGRTWRSDAAPSADADDPLQFLRRDGGGALLAGYGGDGYLSGADRWYRSIDDGLTWQALPGTGRHGDHITGLWWFNGTRGLATTSGGRWLDTDNAGHDWTLRGEASRLPGSLHDLQFTPGGTGWVVGRLPQPRPQLGQAQPPPAGSVYRSLDQGLSWSAIALPDAAAGQVTSLQFVDDRNGFLLAFAGCESLRFYTCYEQMYATRDAGATWQVAGGVWANDGLLRMQSSLRGVRWGPFALYAKRRMFTTSDGGMTWSDGVEPPGAESFAPRRLIARGDRLWLLGDGTADGQGMLLTSTDGGLQWAAQVLPLPADVRLAGLSSGPVLNDIAFADDRNGWIVGRQGLVLATTDGGASWVRQASGSRQTLHALRATGPQTVWIGGTAMSILATASGGR